MKVRIFPNGYGDKPVEVDLGPYGLIETHVNGKKISMKGAWWEGPYLAVRMEDFGTLKVLPRVTNEVWIGEQD